MIEKLAKTMYWFGIIYLVAAIVAAIAAYLAALAEEKEACEVAKIFCTIGLFFSVVLWVGVWLIS